MIMIDYQNLVMKILFYKLHAYIIVNKKKKFYNKFKKNLIIMIKKIMKKLIKI